MSTDEKKPRRRSVKQRQQKEQKEQKRRPTRSRRKIPQEEPKKEEAKEKKKEQTQIKLSSPVFASVKARLHEVNKVRIGKGFSLAEIAKVGLSASLARKLGLYVDPRRKSSHEENIRILNSALRKITS
ncbi:MAG: ribosomal protein L13e [Nitrososphaerota archaeon]